MHGKDGSTCVAGFAAACLTAKIYDLVGHISLINHELHEISDVQCTVLSSDGLPLQRIEYFLYIVVVYCTSLVFEMNFRMYTS